MRMLPRTGLLVGVVVLAVWVGGPQEHAMNQSHNPETGGEHATGRKNRLARESSPYLLLHQSNPVDWYPWGPEALEKARRENKPIFLSIGYSTCYWCHVMERESFSDPEIAALMNRFFVNVKVDREERPDLDDIYMTATQVLTGHGGWPNSLFLTPDLKPFYAGTYFPPHDRQGRSGFASLVRSLSEAWREREAEIREHADEVAATLRRFLEERVESSEVPPPPRVASSSLQALASSFDATWGGFGPAPKFPTPSNLLLLLELADDGAEGREAARMVHETLDRMARGGIYDQLGGGFHRYSTDREWKVPHFEKMLYDNGFLLEIYAREHARSGDPEMARVARETAAWIAREMTSPQGAFYSAIDAETDAREGAYYVWSREELKQILGEEDWQFLAPLYGFEGAPSFEGVDYVLHLPKRLDEVARERRMSPDELAIELAPLAGRLFEARDRRKRPLTDDKILTGWNGIAIAGLAQAGRLLEDPRLVEQAGQAARFLLEHLWPRAEGIGNGAARGPLLHTWRQGKAKLPAFLSDYVFLVRGLLALHEATGERFWLDAAADLTGEQIERLGDPRGGFFDAAQSGELLFRTREIFDGALPAGNSVAALNLLALADRLDGVRARRFRGTAERTLEAFGGLATQYPDAVRMMAVAAHRLGAASEAGSPEVAAEAAKTALEAEARQAVRLTASFHGGAKGGWRRFRVELAIQDGWHVNANPASRDFLVPTRLEAKGAEMRNLSYPEPSRLETAFADGGIAVYEGTVGISGELRGEPALALTYQVCDAERCLLPTTVEVEVE